MIRDRLRHLVHPGEWTLRGRLLGQLVALVAIACLVMVVVTEIGLSTYLYDRLDSQVSGAAGRQLNSFLDPPPPDVGGQPPRNRPMIGGGLQGGEAVLLVVQNDLIVLDGNRKPIAVHVQPGDRTFLVTLLSPADVQALVGKSMDQHPVTVDLPVLGAYRVVNFQTSDGVRVIVGFPLAELNNTLMWAGWLMVGVAAVIVLLTMLAGELIITYTLKPLRRVAATAGRVAELPLERGEVALSVRVPDEDTNPRTEVGQVGSALNRMLGHIANALAVRHASEMRVRKFVADASHELRTPLAAIRGYAELTRRSGDKVPPDVARAMGRVESESVRMTALVEDLLLLARLDAGRPLRRQPVDLTQLVVDSVSDAHVAGPDHKWRVNVPDTPVIVPGDEARLRQVLANLLANARTHTPAGSTVNVTIEPQGDQVRLVVTDDGPGIPPELLPEVFERFARGDSSRSRAAGSTGLGLSIVAAVVAAHQGTVSVSSHAGHTEFSVQLPAD